VLRSSRHHQQGRPPREHGQASLEWLAIVALVSSLFALGAGLAQADAVGRRITREMARALCIVRDGDCARDKEPCVVGSNEMNWHQEVGVLVFRVKSDLTALVERRSDGTIAVSLAGGAAGGIDAKVGLGAEVHAAGHSIGIGGAVTASILAQFKGARTWIAHSEAEVQAILGSLGTIRPSDLTSSELGALPEAGISAGIEEPLEIEVGSASIGFDQLAGAITDHRTGRHTIYISSQLEAKAEALVLGSTGTRDAQEVYSVEMSPTGRPLALMITATGKLTSSRDLPAAVQPVAGRLPTTGADRYEVTAALDLTEPAALAAAADLVDAIAHKHTWEKPSATLRSLVEKSGTLEARILSSDDKTFLSEGGSAKIGPVQVAADSSLTKQTARLLAATSRGLDGQWIVREDCG
jgi:hypothetical protein